MKLKDKGCIAQNTGFYIQSAVINPIIMKIQWRGGKIDIKHLDYYNQYGNNVGFNMKKHFGRP